MPDIVKSHTHALGLECAPSFFDQAREISTVTSIHGGFVYQHETPWHADSSSETVHLIDHYTSYLYFFYHIWHAIVVYPRPSEDGSENT